LDAEVCVHRIKYDTVHMNDTIFTLDGVAGDTSYRSYSLDTYDTNTVYVRITSSSLYFSAYYHSTYMERGSQATMTALTLNTKYPLTVLSPYITIMVYSYGGASDYLLEFGRVDERDYAIS
jgi:hypothetical protein